MCHQERKFACYVQLCVIINVERVVRVVRVVFAWVQLERFTRAFGGPALWIYCVGDTLICRMPHSKSQSESKT